jgi:cell division septal protein FtsQ
MSRLQKVFLFGLLSLIVILLCINTFDLFKPRQFYFEGNKEVVRFYYEGYIQLKATDNSLEVILEANGGEE